MALIITEQRLHADLKLQTVEMYVHQSGFHPPNEQMSTHTRRRYRLMPARVPNPNLPPCDPSLWIVHYSRADANHLYPARSIQVNAQVQTAVTERRFLQQHGQLVRKEFMLHDRNNWPTINLPGGGFQASGYPGNVISHMNRSQQQPYMHPQQMGTGHSSVGPSPSKRPRHAPPVGPNSSIAAATMAQAQDAVTNDEEDTTRGDFMDFLTPKDISTTRYIQHHEWLEEVFNSPFTTGQIVPVHLGLGRKGELEALTKDFFDAPTSGTPIAKTGPVPLPPRVGKMEPGKADDFAMKATAKIAEMHEEMEKLKRQHAKRMAKFKKGAGLREAEQSLRFAALTIDNSNGWKFDERTRSPSSAMAAKNAVGQPAKIEDIVQRVEKEMGKSIVVVKKLECIERGGLEEKGQVADNKTQDYSMINPTADLSRRSSQSASYHIPNDPPSIGHTPQFSYGGGADINEPSTEARGLVGGDGTIVKMPNESENKDTDAGDWIMVNKDGASTPQNEELPNLDNLVDETAMEGVDSAVDHMMDTAGDALQDFTPDVHDTTASDFATNDFSETVDFSNLDTAGDALAGYGEANDDMGLDEQENLGLEDSAFGDAFGDAGTGTGTADDSEILPS